MIHIKRVYEPPEKGDGMRILVDRLWPRGLSKERAKADLWLKDVAPSDALRKWFGHDPAKWAEFRRRYYRELDGKEALVEQIADIARRGTATLVYGAKDEEHNNAAALIEYLRKKGLPAQE